MDCGLLGQIATPAAGNKVVAGRDWCADNSVFADKYPGDDAFLTWLLRLHSMRSSCRFVVAPDVVGDAQATLDRSRPMLQRVRQLGFPVALAAQNGLENLCVPWDSFDCLFIGGDTEWKLGPQARSLTAQAKHYGKWVHMGRVNSWRRLRYAAQIGADSADGTYLARGPDANLPRLLHWLSVLNTGRVPERTTLPRPSLAGQGGLWEAS